MAPSSKAALKAAKAALDASNWDEAAVQAQAVLDVDPQNYFAKLMLGRAYEKQGDLENAAAAYTDATTIKPSEDQAWLGLRSLYETQSAKKLDEYVKVGLKLAEIYANADDAHKAQIAVDKVVDLARAQGTKAQYKRALEVYLPTSPVYGFLEGRVPHPSHTYTRIAEIVEDEEKQRINKEIGERRTRLGARVAQVTTEVKREVYGKSDLEDIYRNVIDWTNDDGVRRQYEEKLLQRAYDTLAVLPAEQKGDKRVEVVNLANGMVIIKHPFLLAWEIELEWKDVETLQEYDANVVREFVEFFPDHGLSRLFKGYLTSDISPFPLKLPQEPKEEDEQKDTEAPLSPEDRLLLMADGFDDAKQSVLASRLMGEYYLHLEEYESAMEVSRKGLQLVTSESQKSGLSLQNSRDVVNSTLGTSLVHYQSPKNHPEAKTIFNDILARKPSFTPALIGVGLVYEEEEKYADAIDFLSRALKRDPENARIGAEAAWCKALNGDHTTALAEFEKYIELMKTTDSRSRQLRALTLYRIGVCIWEIDPTRQARKDRTGAYSSFLQAIKTDPSLAPAYTSLGIFYSDYVRDRKRARQCFQKAFELSPSELEAAERLARSFADQGDWDIVEVISQRAIDSGKCRPSPGSKKKGVSWPFSALGIVQMNKQEYNKSVISFLSALRISPDDYNSYVGLGESYHNSGRYNSALRTFRYAEEGEQMKRPAENWFTKYMLANVNRELGQYDEAIDAYKEVLETRPAEFGVSIALLQTLIERGWRQVETGFFGQAADSAVDAFKVARQVAQHKPEAFNLWKAVGDACSLFTWVRSCLERLPFAEVKSLLGIGFDAAHFNLFSENDGIGQAQFHSLSEASNSPAGLLRKCLEASILAHKRAIHACSQDVHAQAVSWYNLGWTEYRAHVCCEQDVGPKGKTSLKQVKAAMRCFKRAIELEASNTEFWNALGIVTTTLNPKVAQHSFVRSLHLNERNVKTWTNLGVLYLVQNDYELAHMAFSRAQSTDPDYPHAWLGEGLIAVLLGDGKEALSHFTHAFEISDAASLVVKKQYAASTFDHLLTSPAAANNITNLLHPLFALLQVRSQDPTDISHAHLAALYLERVGDFAAATTALEALCATAESDYEVDESPAALARFAQAKADLARNRLASGDFGGAVEDAQLALDLLSDDDSASIIMPAESKRKALLGARLTVGLASYYQRDMTGAIAAFRAALQESRSAPDVVCALAEVLWAAGGGEEKAVARAQLFDAVEGSHQGQQQPHVGAVVLLGAMACVDYADGGGEEERETLEALREDLWGIRARSDGGVDADVREKVDKLLFAIAAVCENGDEAALTAAQRSIMLSPAAPLGWTLLSDVSSTTDSSHAAHLALLTTQHSININAGAEQLAGAYAASGLSAADAQRAVAIAPWMAGGWDALGEAIAAGGGEGV